MKKTLFTSLMCVVLFSTANANNSDENTNTTIKAVDDTDIPNNTDTTKMAQAKLSDLTWVRSPIIAPNPTYYPTCSCNGDGNSLAKCDEQDINWLFKITFNEAGDVAEVTLNQGESYTQLEQDAIAQIKTSVIKPFTVNGKPTSVKTAIRMSLSLTPETDNSCDIK